MNQRTRMLPVLLILSAGLIGGCRTTPAPPPPVVSAQPPTASPPVAEPTPVAPPVARPAWAEAFLNAEELVGQSKDAVVAKIGAPTDTFTIANRYDYITEDYKLFLFFDSKQQLEHAELKFGHQYNAPTAVEAWDAVAPAHTMPQTFMINDSLVKDQLKASGSTSGTWAIALNGKLATGHLIQLNCSSTSPLLTGERTFDTKHDTYTIANLVPDPAADWHAMKVQKILTGKHERSDMVEWGTDHPLTPTSEDGPAVEGD